jgi:hypothetical protein
VNLKIKTPKHSLLLISALVAEKVFQLLSLCVAKVHALWMEPLSAAVTQDVQQVRVERFLAYTQPLPLAKTRRQGFR